MAAARPLVLNDLQAVFRFLQAQDNAGAQEFEACLTKLSSLSSAQNRNEQAQVIVGATRNLWTAAQAIRTHLSQGSDTELLTELSTVQLTEIGGVLKKSSLLCKEI